jgi:hypothetical protein
MNAHAKGEIELPNMDAVLKAMAANKHIWKMNIDDRDLNDFINMIDQDLLWVK